MFKNKDYSVFYGLVLASLILAFAINLSVGPKPEILEVSTTVKVEKKPDIQKVNIGFNSKENIDNKIAFNEAGKFANSFMEYLDSVKVSKDEYKTQNVSVSKSYNYNRKDDDQEYFRANVSFDVKIGSNSKSEVSLSEIIAKSVELGANNVSGVSFEFADDKVYDEQLRNSAAVILRKKAEDIASLYGTKVGKLATYREYKSGGAMPMYARAATMEMAADSVEPIEINPGTKTVQMEVTAGFELR